MSTADALQVTSMGFIVLPYKLNNDIFPFNMQWDAAMKWLSRYVCMPSRISGYQFASANCDISSTISSDGLIVEIQVFFNYLKWVRPCVTDQVLFNVQPTLRPKSAATSMKIDLSNVPSGLTVRFTI